MFKITDVWFLLNVIQITQLSENLESRQEWITLLLLYQHFNSSTPGADQGSHLGPMLGKGDFYYEKTDATNVC